MLRFSQNYLKQFTMADEKSYGAESIKVLEGLEGVRKNEDRKMQTVKEMIRVSNNADSIKLSNEN